MNIFLMKILGGNRVFILLLPIIVNFCDVGVPLKLNGTRPYEIYSECDTIRLYASFFSKKIFINHIVEGQIGVNFHKLKYNIEPDDLVIRDLSYDIDYEEVDSLIQTVKIKNQTLGINVLLNKSVGPEKGELNILPSEYLMCNGEPVIRDTISIKF